MSGRYNNTDDQGLARMVAELSNRLDRLESPPVAAWTSYTPVWSTSGTAPALNDGSLTGAFYQMGRLVNVRIVFIAGPGTTFGTGTYRFSLPVLPKADQIIGALLNDSSASLRWAGQVWIIDQLINGDNMRIIVQDNSGNLTESSPVTLASGDRIILGGVYEAA